MVDDAAEIFAVASSLDVLLGCTTVERAGWPVCCEVEVLRPVVRCCCADVDVLGARGWLAPSADESTEGIGCGMFVEPTGRGGNECLATLSLETGFIRGVLGGFADRFWNGRLCVNIDIEGTDSSRLPESSSL